MNISSNNKNKLNRSICLNPDVETWIVNSVKLKMINRFGKCLEKEGVNNLRKLFLVPIFTVAEMEKRVSLKAPEISTLFYKVLGEVMTEVEKSLPAHQKAPSVRI